MNTCPRCCLSPVTRVGQSCSRCGLHLSQFENNEWRGEELGHKSLLILGLNSYGDIFERLRYLNGLSERGIKWTLVIPEEVLSLLTFLFPAANLSSYSSPIPAFDVWADLRDGSQITTPNRPEQLRLEVPKKVLEVPSPRAGLCFQADEKYFFPKFRSIGRVGAEKIVQSVHNVNWACLQYQETLPAPCLNPKLDSWLATAQVIQSLDVVVTADTAIAHLCVLLRKPFIVLFGTAPTSVVCYKDFREMYKGQSIKEIKPTYGGFEGGQSSWKKFIEWANKTLEWWKPENF